MSSLIKTSHRLGGAEFLHLRGEPVCVFAESGTLWITQDGEHDDVQLDAGQWHRFSGRAPVMIGTLGGAARLRVTRLAPAHGSWAARATRALAALVRLPAAGARV